jgi:hypothetical protein
MTNKEQVSIRLGEELLKKLDALGKSGGKNRSEVIESLLAASVGQAPDSGAGPSGQPAGQAGEISPLPAVLGQRLLRLETWRQRNAVSAARHERNFWWLTIPPMVITAGFGAGLGRIPGLAQLQPLLLVASSLLILLDKERPQERLFSAFERAAVELEELERSLREQWEEGCLAGQAPNKLLAQILASADKEEARLTKYLAGAESYLKQVSPARRLLQAKPVALGFLKNE